ncbi:MULTISPECIES: hypothetical protein [unclassified Microcoleus]|uniref:hypothetical protein n=1 Tax=unclassified Microcoleus TaxID=2642155 RepID=UPI0025E4BD23|nr:MULTISPECIES: hypothetical protein [unclassified Microcoleus]
MDNLSLDPDRPSPNPRQANGIILLCEILLILLQANTSSDKWSQLQQLCPQLIETHWRGYSYIRLFSCCLFEILLIHLPPATDTGIHCHDSWYNVNILIAGEAAIDSKYKIRGGKPKLVEEQKLSKGQFSQLMRYRPHNLCCPGSAICPTMTLNIHFPNRTES